MTHRTLGQLLAARSKAQSAIPLTNETVQQQSQDNLETKELKETTFAGNDQPSDVVNNPIIQ